jgi:hypothetical protein
MYQIELIFRLVGNEIRRWLKIYLKVYIYIPLLLGFSCGAGSSELKRREIKWRISGGARHARHIYSVMNSACIYNSGSLDLLCLSHIYNHNM